MKKIFFVVLMAALWGACQQDDTAVPESDVAPKAPMWMTKTVGDVHTRTANVAYKFWEPGDTIRIKFLSGTPMFQAWVQQYAVAWLDYANLTFAYVGADEEADVKIGFSDDPWLAWSTIGTDCRAVPQNEVSLNFSQFDYLGDSEIKAEVLRGFGHVLGLAFEHQHPDFPYQFKSAKAVADRYGLSVEDAEAMIQKYESHMVSGEYDELSIMMVKISPDLLVDEKKIPSNKSRLSANDKAAVDGLYPRPQTDVMLTTTTTKGSVDFLMELASGIQIDWGDGSQTLVGSGYNRVPTHSYSTGGTHSIVFKGKNSALIFLDCSDNQITSLDVSRCDSLSYLYCFRNRVSSLNLTRNPLLEELNCPHNNLSSLDLSSNVRLNKLDCDSNRISWLDVSACLPIRHVSSRGNVKITDYDALRNLAYSLPYADPGMPGSFWINDGTEYLLRSICVPKNWYINGYWFGRSARPTIPWKYDRRLLQ